MKLCLILFLSLFSTIAVGQYTVNSVPNPKESGLLGYVSNPDGILSADEAGTIDNICRQIEEQDSFQVTVALPSCIHLEPEGVHLLASREGQVSARLHHRPLRKVSAAHIQDE